MKNNLRDVWASGKAAVNGWCSIPNTFTAEMMSMNDFDSVTIDLQHGLVDYQMALQMMQAMSASKVTPLARVPWLEPGIIMKLLDAGALGIICPMVNTAEDAAAFVGATRYAPLGYRSSGPTRAALVHGADYFNESNTSLVSLAMIETGQAVDNVEGIVATDGLTGIYVGPSDLSISMGFSPGLDQREPAVYDAIIKAKDAALAAGIRAGIHTQKPEYAKEMIAAGFSFVTMSTDVRLFGEVISGIVGDMRS
jgi:4-hydroxy-2-oxoheptanedioate aldolase